MKKIILIIMVVFAFISCEKNKENNDIPMDTFEKKLGYAIGFQVAKNLKNENINFDNEAFALAVKDVLNDVDSRMSMEEIQMTMMELQKQKMAEQMKNVTDTPEGLAFLENNKKKKGVKVTKSGLQYRVIKKGKGDSPKSSDTVRVHYKGQLIDGTVFDSSYERKEPIEFPLTNVIAGWTEGLQLMEIGAKYEFVIPTRLGYGPTPKGSIPANSVLVFEVELLDIVK